ncbi:hypothetical protein KEM54_001216 [Ascosphaera aggregata]|nr:hypothetical protein KEM54_001216 [Ascosphaera aggregata]
MAFPISPAERSLNHHTSSNEHEDEGQTIDGHELRIDDEDFYNYNNGNNDKDRNEFANDIDIRNLEIVSDYDDQHLCCTICFCPFIDPIRLPCDHIFCRDCIDNMIRANHRNNNNHNNDDNNDDNGDNNIDAHVGGNHHHHHHHHHRHQPYSPVFNDVDDVVEVYLRYNGLGGNNNNNNDYTSAVRNADEQYEAEQRLYPHRT